MTRRAPYDEDLLRAMAFQLQDPPPEQIVFFGTENQVKEVFYPSQFSAEMIGLLRIKLEDEGSLKAIVHAYIPLLGDTLEEKSGWRTRHGPRLTYLETVSDRKIYSAYHGSGRSLHSMWVDPTRWPEMLAYALRLWGNGEEG